MANLIAAAVFFLAIHFGVSGTRLRDRLVGMVAQRDLMQIDLSEKDEEIRWLNAYIHIGPPGEGA